MEEEKNLAKTEQQRKIATQLVLTIDEAVNPKTMKVMDQGVAANVMRVLLHTRR